MKFSAALCLVLILAAYVACSRSSSYIRYEACRQGCSSKTRACIKSCIAKLSDYADDELADSEFNWFGWFDEDEEPAPAPAPKPKQTKPAATPSSGTTTSTSTTTTTTTVTVNCPPSWPNCKEDLGVKDTKKETTVVVEPPKPKNPHFYSMFFINSVLNSLETNLQFSYGGSVLKQATPLLPEFADNVAQFSQFLNSYGRNEGDLDFHQAYAKFIDSLDMPADFNKTIYSDEGLLKIQNDLKEARQSLADEETKCFARYTGVMQNMYTRDAFKQVFCRTLANFENRVNILIGSEFSKVRELQGQWTMFLEAGPRYKNLEQAKKGLWTKNNKSVKQFQTAAMANSGNSFSVKISRSETPSVGETPASVPESIKNFIIADNVAYTFPTENVTFALEFGAKSVASFPVRPNSDWFSAGLYKQYKDGPFKAGVTSDYFFGTNGVASPFLKQFTLVMDPYVKIISDKSFKDFVKNKKQITIAHMTFDLNKDSQIEVVADSTYEDVYTVTIKRATPQPLMVAAVTASPLL